jgi:hypothetical protein
MESAPRSTSPTLAIIGIALQAGLAVVVALSLVSPAALSGTNAALGVVIVLSIPIAVAGFVISALAIGLRGGVGRSLGIVGVSLGALVFVGFIASIVVSASSVFYAVG